MRSKVLLITPDFPPGPGGIQRLMGGLVRHMRGVDTRVLTFASPAAEEFDRRETVDVVRMRRPPGGQFSAVLALNLRALYEAVRFKPGVLVGAHIVTSPATAALRLALKTPVIQYLHAAELGFRPRLARFALQRADVSVAVSRHTERLARELGVDRIRLRRIPPGVDLPERTGAQRAGRPTVLTVARLDRRYKGHDVLIEAVHRVRARIPDVRWVVVGDGALRAELEQLAASRGLDGCVEFAGTVSEEVRDGWLREAHVFAMPSRLPEGGVGGEGFGIAFLEASAWGLPVVAGNVGGALDAVIHDETGLLVDPEDPVAVADAITSLLRNPEGAERLGAAGAARAREFSWPLVARRVEQLVEELAGRSR